ncbi:MAG TPA: glycosyltransferase family 2 protein [Blastocatellia bacterium]|nr:glycosyltransferase family 2 protein [Blastocatellia bacterium]HMX25937.1 glycosyltransferase family 2 protein [Blastocatellia bacterium]HMY70497.1 glycosyltransferase family 2 protein [Blastocatellia bacterium]
MATPAVYIIVLTYNSREIVRPCLQSLRALTYPNLQIVVVDNASADGTETMVRAEFSDLPLIQTGGNHGYTGGNNRGIEYALAQGANYVLLLNPDTVLANPKFVDEMVAYLEANPRVGIAGPRVFFREAGVVQNTVLYAPGLWRSIHHWVRYRINPRFAESSGDIVVEAGVLNGVCVMLRAACLRETGSFDENIFMYIEDADLDYRAQQHGWHVQYLPIDSVIHQQKAEGYHLTGWVSFLLKRNSVYYLCKIGKRLDAWGYAILSLLMLVARGALKFQLREHLAFCRKLFAAYRQILLRQKFNASFGPPFGQLNQ